MAIYRNEDEYEVWDLATGNAVGAYQTGEEATQALERIYARGGARAVRGLALVATHAGETRQVARGEGVLALLDRGVIRA